MQLCTNIPFSLSWTSLKGSSRNICTFAQRFQDVRDCSENSLFLLVLFMLLSVVKTVALKIKVLWGIWETFEYYWIKSTISGLYQLFSVCDPFSPANLHLPTVAFSCFQFRQLKPHCILSYQPFFTLPAAAAAAAAAATWPPLCKTDCRITAQVVQLHAYSLVLWSSTVR